MNDEEREALLKIAINEFYSQLMIMAIGYHIGAIDLVSEIFKIEQMEFDRNASPEVKAEIQKRIAALPMFEQKDDVE